MPARHLQFLFTPLARVTSSFAIYSIMRTSKELGADMRLLTAAKKYHGSFRTRPHRLFFAFASSLFACPRRSIAMPVAGLGSPAAMGFSSATVSSRCSMR